MVNWPEALKALLIATAIDIGDDETYYGHGLLNTFDAVYTQPAFNGPAILWVDSITKTTFPRRLTFTLPQTYNHVRVVLTWADLSIENDLREIVNDLAMYVYNTPDCSGNSISPNNSHDESVEITTISSQLPAKTTWCVRVRAFSLEDDIPQPFALVIMPVIHPPGINLNC